MKVRKINNDMLLKKITTAIFLISVGAYLHALNTPNQNNSWDSDATPYVLTMPLSKTDISQNLLICF